MNPYTAELAKVRAADLRTEAQRDRLARHCRETAPLSIPSRLSTALNHLLLRFQPV